MADRAAIRVVIDVGFLAAILACAITAYATSGAPAIPDGVCTSTKRAPRYDAMLADGKLQIAAVFGELAGGAIDHNAWSFRVLADGLRDRGFVEVEPDRFRRGRITVDLALVADDPAQSTAAIAGALASHDVVYYNGHSHDGDITITPPTDYRLLVLDSCWSTQHFAAALVGGNLDLISNSERSVTGSVDSALVLIDALAANNDFPLDEMNALAVARLSKRVAVSKYREPERYRLDAACETKQH